SREHGASVSFPSRPKKRSSFRVPICFIQTLACAVWRPLRSMRRHRNDSEQASPMELVKSLSLLVLRLGVAGALAQACGGTSDTDGGDAGSAGGGAGRTPPAKPTAEAS